MTKLEKILESNGFVTLGSSARLLGYRISNAYKFVRPESHRFGHVSVTVVSDGDRMVEANVTFCHDMRGNVTESTICGTWSLAGSVVSKYLKKGEEFAKAFEAGNETKDPDNA